MFKKLFLTAFINLFLLTSTAYAFWGDSDIDLVKNGVLGIDSTLSVGDAFENHQFLSKGEWTSFEGEQKRKMVQFSAVVDVQKSDLHEIRGMKGSWVREGRLWNVYDEGSLFYDIKDTIKITVQFVIDVEGEHFEISYLGLQCDGDEATISQSDREQALQDIYNNSMPFQFQLGLILLKTLVLNEILYETENLSKKFIIPNRGWMKKLPARYDKVKDTYIKIKELTYSEIVLEGTIAVFARGQKENVFRKIDNLKISTRVEQVVPYYFNLVGGDDMLFTISQNANSKTYTPIIIKLTIPEKEESFSYACE